MSHVSNNRSLRISIHAPAKGATKTGSTVKMASPFQSTLPRRERRKQMRGLVDVFAISIHAPAKGATAYVHRGTSRGVDFNPRSREGSDSKPSDRRHGGAGISIHAPAKGATLSGWCLQEGFEKFQSTLPRRERHGRIKRWEVVQMISIHAPAKGAT